MPKSSGFGERQAPLTDEREALLFFLKPVRGLAAVTLYALLYALPPLLWIGGYGMTLLWLSWKSGAAGEPRPPFAEMLLTAVMGLATWPFAATWLLYDQHREHRKHRSRDARRSLFDRDS